MFTSAYRFSQVLCLIFIYFIFADSDTGSVSASSLMLSNREPKFILSGRITNSKILIRHMLCFVFPSFHYVE